MSLDDDYFDLRSFLEEFESDRDRECMLGALDRINDFNNQVAEDNKELHRQIAALKAAIVVKESAGIKITEPYCDAGRYIKLELKNLDKSVINKYFASEGGKKSKKGKRSDLKKGGSTYNKIHGKKGESDGVD